MSRPANKASIAPNSTPGWPSRSEIPALTLSQSTPFALYAPSGAPRGQGATPFGAPEGVRAAHTQGALEGVPEGVRAGSSTDPGQPEVGFRSILALAGRAAHLEAVRRARHRLSHGSHPTRRCHPAPESAPALPWLMYREHMKEDPVMAESDKMPQQDPGRSEGRRNFFYAVAGGIVAALAGWLSGGFPSRATALPQGEHRTPTSVDSRVSALEGEVARLAEALLSSGAAQRLGELEGEFNERIVFNKRELTVANPEGVLVNLVATKGHVGFRFYKDFGFGNETIDSPWSIFIEGIEGYQGLAFLRDWRFTAALWDEDGKLLLGRLHPHPPANDPARARLHVRGTLDEVQSIVEASADQTSDVFQVIGSTGTSHFAVNGEGNVVVGSAAHPREVVLHDTQNGAAYSLKVTNGQLTLARA